MSIEEKIQRINELARKAKTEGLTDNEKEEQANLRREYIDAFKANLRQTLDNTYIATENGEKRKLSEKPKETHLN